jgi:hypothetical protein
MRLAVIVPILDRAATIEASLRALAPLRRRGHRVIVVDGGSRDDGPARACALADRVVAAPRGWAWQAHAGGRAPEAECADALVFLPEGLRLPPEADRAIARALDNARSPWGYFELGLVDAAAAAPLPLRLAAALANAGARATGLALAEQALFITRAAYVALAGYCGEAPQPQEPPDVAFCRRARLLGAPIRLRQRVQVQTAERAALPVLRRALRHECWRLALGLELPWRPRGTVRWSEL